VPEQGLPQNLDAERYVLGAVLIDAGLYMQAADLLKPEDFTLESHRAIFKRMGELASKHEAIEPVTLFHELEKHRQTESVGGLSYLLDLSHGIPQGLNVDAYAKVVKEKSQLRKIVFAAHNLIHRVNQGQVSSAEILQDAAKLFRECEDGQANVPANAAAIIAEAGGIEKFPEPTQGIQTKWRLVNQATGGWQPGELALIAARPSMGKTAFAINALWYAADNGKPAIFYSCEMKPRSILLREISLLTGITYQDLQKGELTATERRLIATEVTHIRERPFEIIQASGKSVMNIWAHARRAKRQNRLSIAAIDYIGLIRGGDKMQNRNQELGERCRQLKDMAGELDIPLIVLSQLSRKPENRSDPKPVMSDLRDSGELEEHADLIGLLHREGYYKREDASLRRKAQLIISKQRNGDTPTIQLDYEQQCGKFSDVTHREEGK
jgi:replicative DNA helicase